MDSHSVKLVSLLFCFVLAGNIQSSTAIEWDEDMMFGVGPLTFDIWYQPLSTMSTSVTWQAASQNKKVKAIAIDGDVIYAIGQNDGGKIWKQSLKEMTNDTDWISYDSGIGWQGLSVSGDYIYAVGSDECVWSQSLSNGTGFHKVSKGSARDVAVVGGNVYIVGGNFKIYAQSLQGMTEESDWTTHAWSISGGTCNSLVGSVVLGKMYCTGEPTVVVYMATNANWDDPYAQITFGDPISQGNVNSIAIWSTPTSAPTMAPTLPTPAPTRAPTPPTPPPTTAPTASPTTAPTEAPKKQGMHGDPHARNLAGERFDVTQSGEHRLMEFPRGSFIFDLAVNVSIARLQKKLCESVFIERAWLKGSWLGDIKDMTFTAGSLLQASSFRAVLTHFSWGEMTMHHSRMLLAQDSVALVEQSGTRPRVTIKAKANGRIDSFIIKFGDLELEVQHIQHRHLNYLNVEVQGLAQVQAEVGGLLGMDSHTAANVVPANCRRKTRNFLLSKMTAV